MATIHLNNKDLRTMIREAVERLCEEQWYETEALCRIPYFVSVTFTDHAIDREYERDIDREDIIENLKQVIHQVIKDFYEKKIDKEADIRVVDRDSCIVTVCGIRPSYNQRRIHQLTVITCYIWDGRINIDKGNVYYLNDESPAYREAKQWNEENQDKVLSYTEWKHHGDWEAIKQQRLKANKEYYWRTHPQEPSPEKRMNRVNAAFSSKEKAEKYAAHQNLPDGDLKAIQDYFRDMNQKKIELEPLREFAHKAAKKALREALSSQTNTNASTTRKSRKNDFCA